MSRSSGVYWHRKVIEYALHLGSSDSANPGLWVSLAASAANRHTVFISWEPPPLGFVKINFDGSVRGRCAGAAFVIRGAVGRMLARSSGVCWYRKEFEEPHRFLGIRRASPFPRNSKSLTVSQEFEEPHRFPRIRRASPFPKNLKSLIVPISGGSAGSGVCFSPVDGRQWFVSSVRWRCPLHPRSAVSSSSGVGVSCPVILNQSLYSDISGLTRTRVV